MSTILIATDFSEASKNAFVYGLQMARHLQARIVLLNVISPLNASDTNLEPVTGTEKEADGLVQFKEQAESLLSDNSVSITYITRQGRPADEIVAVAGEVNAKWILAGLKRSNDSSSKINGSTSRALSEQHHFPLILIPELARFNAHVVITLVNDLVHEPAMFDFSRLIEFGTKTQAGMNIVNVPAVLSYNEISRSAQPLRVRWQLKELHPSIIYLRNPDAISSICYNIKDNETNILAYVAHESGLMNSWFKKEDICSKQSSASTALMVLPATKVKPLEKDTCKKDDTCKKCPDCQERAALSQVGIAPSTAH